MKLMMKGELQLMKTDETVEWLRMYYCYSIAGSLMVMNFEFLWL